MVRCLFCSYLSQLLYHAAAATGTNSDAFSINIHALEVWFLASNGLDIGVADVVGTLGFFGTNCARHAHIRIIAYFRGLEYN